MYTVIIITLIVTVLYFINPIPSRIVDRIAESIIAGVFGFIIGFIIALAFPCDYVYSSKYTYLEAIGDNQSTSGDFFLGTGSIESTMYYHYYYKTKTGFKYGKIKAKEATLIYSNNHPSIERIYRYEDVNDWRHNFSIINSSLVKTNIHIPKSSITSNYKFDLQ
jgi:hypothetical protein